MSDAPEYSDGEFVFEEKLKQIKVDAVQANLDRIRKETGDRAESARLGGVREWFDIAFLLRQIDVRDRILEQAGQLADEGAKEYKVVNAYQLRAVLDGAEL